MPCGATRQCHRVPQKCDVSFRKSAGGWPSRQCHEVSWREMACRGGAAVSRCGCPVLGRCSLSTVQFLRVAAVVVTYLPIAHYFRYFFSERRDSSTPQIVGMPIVMSKTTFCRLWPWNYSPRCDLILAEVSFRVRYGAP